MAKSRPSCDWVPIRRGGNQRISAVSADNLSITGQTLHHSSHPISSVALQLGSAVPHQQSTYTQETIGSAAPLSVSMAAKSIPSIDFSGRFHLRLKN